MRIGVDVMGGDNAPHAILEGALASLERLGPEDRLVLVGDENIIRSAVDGAGVGDRVEIIATTEVIGMHEPPATAVRAKPDIPRRDRLARASVRCVPVPAVRFGPGRGAGEWQLVVRHLRVRRTNGQPC